MLGSAGLGKTELVKSVGRALLADGTGARFSAIIFVELRARDSELRVRDAIANAWRGAGLVEEGQMRDALIILDNADDSYKATSNVEEHWFECGIVDKLQANGPAAILITMRDEGQRSLFNRDASMPIWGSDLDQQIDLRSAAHVLLGPCRDSARRAQDPPRAAAARRRAAI